MTVRELLDALVDALERVPGAADVELHPDPPASVSINPSPGARLLLVALDADERVVLGEYPLDRTAP